MDEEWDHPSKDNWYAMQTACEIRRVLSRDPNHHQTGQLRIQFVRDKGDAKRQVSDAESTAESKGVWKGAVMGAKPIKERPKK